MEKKLNFTDQALNQINLITKGDEKKYFRITVQGGGCSGFKYSFGFISRSLRKRDKWFKKMVRFWFFKFTAFRIYEDILRVVCNTVLKIF